MAEAELEQAPKKKLDLAPDKLEAKPLIQPSADVDYLKNAAGWAARGEAKLELKSIPVRLGVGGGAIKLNYFPQIQPFYLGSAELDTNVGLRGNIYARTVFASLPKTDFAVKQNLLGGLAGTSWDVLPLDGSISSRIGFELSGKAAFTEEGITGGYANLAAGSSILYGNWAFFAIGRFLIAPTTPIEQYWTDIRPNPAEAKVGITVDTVKGMLGLSGSISPFEKIGSAYYLFDSLPLTPEILVDYRKTESIFGSSNEVTLGISLKLDGPIPVSARARVEAGGNQINTAESTGPSLYGALYSGDIVASYLYDTGKISAVDLLKRTRPEATNVSSDGTNVTYTGGGQTWTMPVAALSHNYTGEDKYFLDALVGSSSIEDFSSKYSGRSIEEIVLTANRLAQWGGQNYNYALKEMSVFSSGRKGVSKLDPNEEFRNIQGALIENKQIDAGICANINGLAAEFMRQAGVEAYAIGLQTVNGPHIIAAALDANSNKSYIVDYENQYRANGAGIWPVIQKYAQNQGLNILGVYVYGEQNKLIGYYKGPEGRLMDTALGIEERDRLEGSLTRRRKRE